MSSDVKSEPDQVSHSQTSIDNASNNEPRQNLIETAVKFLQNPQVQSSAISTRKAFLIKKGLTEKEIEIAIERSGVNNNNQIVPFAGNSVQPSQQLQPASYRPQGWRGYAILGVFIGSVAYCVYRFYQNVIAPLLRRRREEVEALKAMEEAVNQLKDSVSETVNEVQKMAIDLKNRLDKHEQQLGGLGYDIARNKEIKSEVISLKGLLLSRNQFPRTPKPSPIPAWQMASTKSPDKEDEKENAATSITETAPSNNMLDGTTNHNDNQGIEAEEISETNKSLEILSTSTHVTTPMQMTDGQVRVTRSLSGSFEGSLSPSKILHGSVTQFQNGDVPINGHLPSGESFQRMNNDHDDSNKSDDSVD